MRFGEILKKLRHERRLSLRDFTIQMQCNSVFLSKIERGVIEPPNNFCFLNRIDKVLKLEVLDSLELLNAFLRGDNIIPQKKMIPAFPRSVNGEKPTKEQVDKMIDIING